MAQRHVAFYERHVALHECHVALHEGHVALMCAMLPLCAPCCPSYIQTLKCLFELLLRHIQPTLAIGTVENTPLSDVACSHL